MLLRPNKEGGQIVPIYLACLGKTACCSVRQVTELRKRIRNYSAISLRAGNIGLLRNYIFCL